MRLLPVLRPSDPIGSTAGRLAYNWFCLPIDSYAELWPAFLLLRRCYDWGGSAMRRLSIALGFMFLVSAALVPSGPSPAATPKETHRQLGAATRVSKLCPGKIPQAAVPGPVLVKFRRGVDRATARSFHAAMGARLEGHIAGGLGIDVVRLPKGLSLQ